MKLLFDENFDHDIIRGFRLRNSTADITRVQDVGLRTRDDDAVLEYAAADGRLLVTSDVRTIEPNFKARIAAGWQCPGILLIRQNVPIRQVIDDLVLFVECSEPDEWTNQIVRLPLK